MFRTASVSESGPVTRPPPVHLPVLAGHPQNGSSPNTASGQAPTAQPARFFSSHQASCRYAEYRSTEVVQRLGSYTLDGLVLSESDFNGQTRSYQYDSARRLKLVDHPGSTPDPSYA